MAIIMGLAIIGIPFFLYGTQLVTLSDSIII